jgi:hypothetical protein
MPHNVLVHIITHLLGSFLNDGVGVKRRKKEEKRKKRLTSKGRFGGLFESQPLSDFNNF